MSDNNLTNIKQMSNEQIMQAIGQDDGSNACLLYTSDAADE